MMLKGSHQFVENLLVHLVLIVCHGLEEIVFVCVVLVAFYQI
jgi:hypothetical protein